MDQAPEIRSSGDFISSSAADEGAPKGFVGRVPHVLIVDSDPTTALPLRDQLTHDGYRVSWLQTGQQAALALRGPVLIDLVIADYFDVLVNGPGLLQDVGTHAVMQKPFFVIASEWLDEFHPAWTVMRKRLHPVAQKMIAAYITKPYALPKMNAFIRGILGGVSEPADLSESVPVKESAE